MILLIDNLLTSIIHLENFKTQLIALKIIILSDCQLLILNYAADLTQRISVYIIYIIGQNRLKSLLDGLL